MFLHERTMANILSSRGGKALSWTLLAMDLKVRRAAFGAWRLLSPLSAHNGFLLLHSCFAKVCWLLMTDSSPPQMPHLLRPVYTLFRSFQKGTEE